MQMAPYIPSKYDNFKESSSLIGAASVLAGAPSILTRDLIGLLVLCPVMQ
jgi:hypothetical protein